MEEYFPFILARSSRSSRSKLALCRYDMARSAFLKYSLQASTLLVTIISLFFFLVAQEGNIMTSTFLLTYIYLCC